METVKVVLNQEKELVFVGETIFHTHSDEFTTDVGRRWFELEVFARQDGGYVPAIYFRSTCEPGVTIAEHVDSYKDIENFYFVFEPTEVLDLKQLTTVPVEQRQRLTKGLTELFDTELSKVLLAAKAYIAEHPYQEVAPRKEKKGVFGLFGRHVD